MFTKSQLFTAAAVAASASTVLAAPVFSDVADLEMRAIPESFDELYVRGPGASKEIKDSIAKAASSRAGRKVATEIGKNVYTKVAGNALDEQKKKDAAKQQGHSSGKRDLDVILDYIYARGPGASKEIKDSIAKAASSRAGRKVATEVGKNVYTKIAGNALDEQKKKDAAKQQGHSSGKRDLDAVLEALEARDFDEIDDLFARGPGASKEIKDSIAKAASSRAGRKVATEVGKNVYTKIAGNALDEQKKKDAAKQQGHSSGKRDLDAVLDAPEARDFDELDEIFARGPGASKEIKDSIAKAASSRAGRKVATEVGKNVYTKIAGNALDEQKKKDAAKQQGHSSGKRELDALLDALDARDLDDFEELFARGPGASKEIKDSIAKAASSRAGRKVATEVGKNVYTKIAGNALDEQKKKDAAKQQGHSSGKRDLDALLDALDARDFDDFEELYVRGPGASKEIKDSIAKAASSRAGRKVATEVGKNVYTKIAGNALDEQKKKDAAKQQGHSSGKRDLDALLEALEAREFDDFEDLFARGPGASKEIKDSIAKAASSRAGRKVATEVGKNVYTKIAGNALDEQKKKDAAKQQGHSSGKRDLDAVLDALEARDFEELDYIFARGPGASKEIKDSIAKAASSRAGRKVATEVGKNVYTKIAGNALDEQKKKDAAKHQGGQQKRDDLVEFIARELELYDELD